MTMRTLRAANIAFVAAILIHGADHARQGYDSISDQVLYGGAVLALVGFSTLAFTLRDSPKAPLYCTIVGFYTAIAVTAAHIAPHWSAFSNSYTNDISVDVLSWAAMLAEVVTAAVMGYVGLMLTRRPSPAPA